ncbi:MAG: transglycosylase SLT domain-containing protein [Holosporaceae bacterium]|nr:transglycosylase SLT domain-containing protein [Holosporaceae bacterium]
MFRVVFVFFAALNFICASGAERNGTSDGYFAQHDLCENEIANAERKYGIPYRLLMAIGTVESGRLTKESKAKRPYPWTICAGGKSYFFSTKSAAIAAVKRLMGQGKRNIDVGCMQVNLMHHGKAFKNLEEAFTPKYNVDYAARFFTELKNAHNSWTHAVGYYHSHAAKYYKPYCSLVYKAWTNARGRPINTAPRVRQASAEVKSSISFLPSYYALADRKISARLHQLGRRTLNRGVPKFFLNGASRKGE